MKHIIFLLMLGMSIVIVGCASSKDGDVYSRDEVRKVQNVQMGVVESTRPVKIEGTKSSIGAGAGALAGGIAGSSAGQGRGSSIDAVVGAVVGGIAGAAMEEGLTRENGLEITVRLEGGKLISVVQTGNEEFKPGDKVRVLQGNGETHITH